MKTNTSLFIVQPLLASYRKELFEDMTEYFDEVHVFADLYPKNGFSSPQETKFEKTHTPMLGSRNKVYYQQGILKYIIKNRPSHIYLTHDFRALSFWCILILAKVLNIPTFGHGQGLYDKPNPSLLHKIMFKSSIHLLTKYICYTQSVLKSLESIGIDSNKLSVMENTIVNNYPISPHSTERNSSKLFYLGRLRKGSNLKLLLQAMIAIKSTIPNISLKIIGDGEEKEELMKFVEKNELDVTFYGSVYDDEKISELSKDCTFGVYPGDSGLSIVHYMSLSLIPIVHSDLAKHMGPEPSYIQNEFNGLTFERDSYDSLVSVIISSINDKELQGKISQEAFNTYLKLSETKMSKKLIDIINGEKQ